MIYSTIITIIVCIGFVVVTTAAALGYGSINWLHQQAISATSFKFGNGMFQAHVHSPGLDDALSTGKSLAGGLIFFIWFICAIFTGLFENFENLSSETFVDLPIFLHFQPSTGILRSSRSLSTIL